MSSFWRMLSISTVIVPRSVLASSCPAPNQKPKPRRRRLAGGRSAVKGSVRRGGGDGSAGRLRADRRRRSASATRRTRGRVRRVVDRPGGKGLPQRDLARVRRWIDGTAPAHVRGETRLVATLVSGREPPGVHVVARGGEDGSAVRPPARRRRGAEDHLAEGGPERACVVAGRDEDRVRGARPQRRV